MSISTQFPVAVRQNQQATCTIAAATPSQRDQATAIVASTALQNTEAAPTQLSRPITVLTTSELQLRLNALVQEWQQNQNRQVPTGVQQTLKESINTIIDEITTRILAEGVSTVIPAYDRWLSGSSPTPMLDDVQTWLQAATQKRVSLLSTTLRQQLHASALGKYMTRLFKLEKAYEDHNIARISSFQKLRGIPKRSKHIPHINTWLEERQKTNERLSSGIQYYTAIQNRCQQANLNTLYAERHTLNSRECKDYLAFLIGNNIRSKMIAFLDVRTALEDALFFQMKDPDSLFKLQRSFLFLSEEDQEIFANRCSISVDEWPRFWLVYERYASLEGYCAQYAKQAEKRAWELSINRTFLLFTSPSKERQESDARIVDRILQYAPESLRKVIDEMKPLITLETDISEFMNIGNPSTEQLRQHITACQNSIQSIEAVAHTEPTSVTACILQVAIKEYAKYSIAPTLLQYKAALERLQGSVTEETQRSEIVRDLAQSATAMEPINYNTLIAYIRVLYPVLSGTLDSIAGELRPAHA